MVINERHLIYTLDSLRESNAEANAYTLVELLNRYPEILQHPEHASFILKCIDTSIQYVLESVLPSGSWMDMAYAVSFLNALIRTGYKFEIDVIEQLFQKIKASQDLATKTSEFGSFPLQGLIDDLYVSALKPTQLELDSCAVDTVGNAVVFRAVEFLRVVHKDQISKLPTVDTNSLTARVKNECVFQEVPFGQDVLVVVFVTKTRPDQSKYCFFSGPYLKISN